jgi:hypothetical protein
METHGDAVSIDANYCIEYVLTSTRKQLHMGNVTQGWQDGEPADNSGDNGGDDGGGLPLLGRSDQRQGHRPLFLKRRLVAG